MAAHLPRGEFPGIFIPKLDQAVYIPHAPPWKKQEQQRHAFWAPKSIVQLRASVAFSDRLPDEKLCNENNAGLWKTTVVVN